MKPHVVSSSPKQKRLTTTVAPIFVWGFSNNLDAYSSSVVGFLPDTSGIPLTSYGFRGVWLNK